MITARYHAFSNRGIEVKPPISFFVRLGAVSSPRPEAYVAPRAAAVNDGRRRSPQAIAAGGAKRH
jgi:hypothetical protein